MGRLQAARLGGILLASVMLTWGVLVPAPSAGQDSKTEQTDDSPLDQPIAWLQEAKKNYNNVRDLTCTLVTRENVRGNL